MYAASIHSSTRTCVSHAFYCHGPKCVCVSFVKLVLYFSAPPRTIGVVMAALNVDCATRSRFGSSRLHYIRSVCVCVSAPLALRKRTREAPRGSHHIEMTISETQLSRRPITQQPHYIPQFFLRAPSSSCPEAQFLTSTPQERRR